MSFFLLFLSFFFSRDIDVHLEKMKVSSQLTYLKQHIGACCVENKGRGCGNGMRGGTWDVMTTPLFILQREK